MAAPLKSDALTFARVLLEGYKLQHTTNVAIINELFASYTLLNNHGYQHAANLVQFEIFAKIDRTLSEHEQYRKSLEDLRGKRSRGKSDMFGWTFARLQQKDTKDDFPKEEDVEKLVQDYENICGTLLTECKEWMLRDELSNVLRERLVRTWELN